MGKIKFSNLVTLPQSQTSKLHCLCLRRKLFFLGIVLLKQRVMKEYIKIIVKLKYKAREII